MQKGSGRRGTGASCKNCAVFFEFIELLQALATAERSALKAESSEFAKLRFRELVEGLQARIFKRERLKVEVLKDRLLAWAL